MTKIFVDCEFNGFGGQLISMALVADDGNEWYGILPLPAEVDPWVAEHVIPVLNGVALPPRVAVAPDKFRKEMHEWLSQYYNPTIIADWYTDLVHFFGQFQGKDHSESFDYPCKAELVPNLVAQPDIPHNALSDAIAIRRAYLRMAA